MFTEERMKGLKKDKVIYMSKKIGFYIKYSGDEDQLKKKKKSERKMI